MGARSRKRRARRAWLVPLVLPLLRTLTERVRKASPRRAYRLALALGRLFAWIGLTRAVVRRNLRLATGRELDPAAMRRFERAYYRHLGLLLVEFLRQPALTRETLAHHVEPSGLEQVRAAYAEGRGLICIAGHAGLWELAGHLGGLLGLTLTSVAKLSGHPQIDGFVGGIREAGGQRIRDVHGSLWAMKKALKRGEAVGINIDQEVRQGIVFAPFFGIPAATSSAPAALHLRTGAPILVLTVHRRAPFRYALEVFADIRHPPSGDKAADTLAITTRINQALEAAIRRHPEQWLWSHRRWRRRPDEPTPFQRVVAGRELRLEPQTAPGA